MSSSEDQGKGCAAVLVLGGFFIAGIVWLVVALSGGFNFSNGYRDGYVQKFSEKGWVWKTHEGEMAMAGFRGNKNGVSSIWSFSVLDDDVRKQLEDVTEEDHVRLHYKQYWGVLPWYGDSQYRIVRVEKLERKKGSAEHQGPLP